MGDWALRGGFPGDWALGGLAQFKTGPNVEVPVSSMMPGSVGTYVFLLGL